MSEDKPVGRAPVRRPPRGRAKVGRAIGKAPHPDRAPTDVIRSGDPETAPIFVDPSGVRRRRLRIAAYVAAIVLVMVLVAIWLSQLSGPAGPPQPAPCASAGCER